MMNVDATIAAISLLDEIRCGALIVFMASFVQ